MYKFTLGLFLAIWGRFFTVQVNTVKILIDVLTPGRAVEILDDLVLKFVFRYKDR